MSSRPLSPAGVALLVLVVAGGLWAGAGFGRIGAEERAIREATRSGGAGAGLVALHVRRLDGEIVKLNAGGLPTVVMVSSETCFYCKAALREMGKAAGGRPLTGLRLVTLEGPDAGVPMLREAGVVGATLAGPASAAAAATWAFQIQGTPTFVALDDRGQVTETMVGYPGSETLRSWIDVMLGERAAP